MTFHNTGQFLLKIVRTTQKMSKNIHSFEKVDINMLTG